MYELVTQISREYSDPIIEITESGCVYLMGPMKKKTAAYSTAVASGGTAKCSRNWLARSPMERDVLLQPFTNH
jgi:hypothetical protein